VIRGAVFPPLLPNFAHPLRQRRVPAFDPPSYMGSHQIQKLTKFEPSNGQPNPQMDPKRYPKIGPKADPNTDPNTRSKKKITDPKT
jgi:hypothetical protein